VVWLFFSRDVWQPCWTWKRAKLFVVVPYLVPNVGVKVKLLKFESLQVKLLQYSAKIATYSLLQVRYLRPFV